MPKEIWIFAEQKYGNLSRTAFELLTVAQKLAEPKSASVAAVLFGHQSEGLTAELFGHGAQKVYLADAPGLEKFVDESYAAVLADLIQKHQPEIVLGAATFSGKALFPRLAALLQAGIITDAIAISADTQPLAVTRPAYGGNVFQELTAQGAGSLLLTCRPKAFAEAPAAPGRTGEIVRHPVPEELLTSPTTVREAVKAEGQKVSLTEADVIVSGGRGLREPANFKLIADLAAALGGAVGASRAVVDAGWIPYAHQVGQTGKTVNPKLYIACGVSGAIQHRVGMQSARVIVAINRDKDAPIFDIATYGIVGDLFEIVPALIKKFKEKLGR